MNRRTRSLLVSTAALGAAAAAGTWLYKRWGYRVRHTQRDVAHAPDPPPTEKHEPPGRARIQTEDDGAGARFHRRYEVDIEATSKTPQALIACIGEDIQAFVPDEIAVFEKTVGVPDRLAVGDEFDIEIRSPWDGPVRVVEAEPERFTLATLEGHLEAGQIRFAAMDHPTAPGALRFAIESWARSRDGVVDFVYDELGLAKSAQQAMWTFFCERVADSCGGGRMDDIRVLTEREPVEEDAEDEDPDDTPEAGGGGNA